MIIGLTTHDHNQSDPTLIRVGTQILRIFHPDGDTKDMFGYITIVVGQDGPSLGIVEVRQIPTEAYGLAWLPMAVGLLDPRVAIGIPKDEVLIYDPRHPPVPGLDRDMETWLREHPEWPKILEYDSGASPWQR